MIFFLIFKILSFDFSIEILISKIFRFDFFCVTFNFLNAFFIYKIYRFDFQNETFDFSNRVFDFQNETFDFAKGVLVLNGFVSVHVAVTCDRAHGRTRYVRTYKAHGT